MGEAGGKRLGFLTLFAQDLLGISPTPLLPVRTIKEGGERSRDWRIARLLCRSACQRGGRAMLTRDRVYFPELTLLAPEGVGPAC